VSTQTRHANHASSQTQTELTDVDDSTVSMALRGDPSFPRQFSVLLMHEHGQT